VARTTWVESIFKQRWRVYRAQFIKDKSFQRESRAGQGQSYTKPVLSLNGNRRQNGPLVNGSSLVK
jgi:hypothetical protein